MRYTLVFPLLSLLMLALPASANDSSAQLDAGGLRLIDERDIVMESEDLYISRKKIHIEYVFRNTSAADKTITVAFPLPKVETATLHMGDIGVQSEDPVNFVDFKVWAGGKPVPVKQDVRAWVKNRDVTALLRQHNIPLSVMHPKFYDSLRNVHPATLNALKAAGALDATSTAEEAYPAWIYQVGYYWQQTFPAGKTVKFVQTYKPVVGGSVGSVEHMVAVPEEMSRMSQLYCIDLETQKAIRTLQTTKGKEQYILGYNLGYILTTANNWRGPIGRFRLFIHTDDPGEIMATCVPGLKRINATRWQVEHNNYRPARDLQIFFAAKGG